MSVGIRLGWYRRRLALMQPAEVFAHGRRVAEARADALAWNVARREWARRWDPSDARVFDAGTPGREPLGFLTRERAALLRRELPDAADEAIAEAHRRAEGHVTLLGYPSFVLEPDWDGATDPFSGASWPDRHGRLIDFRHDQPGDPKLIWELHRLQELPLLVLASHLERDDRLERVALQRMLAWLVRNPPGRGIAWANSFEPGLRAVSLAVAFDGMRGSPGLDDDASRVILRGLWQHGRWIARGLSRYSSANNHLTGELVGLLAVGVLAPELLDSGTWASFATSELAQQSTLQILDDGAGAEQSFAYSVFVLDLLLLAVALLESRDLDVPTPLLDALDRAGSGLALLLEDGEPDPAFGDSDDGRALVLDGSGGRGGRGVAAAIAVCRGHRGARRVAEGADATAIVLFGEQGTRRFAGTLPADPAESGVLPDAGLVVFRLGGVRALFDVGRLGYLSIAAHGHADALSIAVSCADQEMVVDPGTGSYRDASLRRWFRGTPAHATVTIDGLDQSEQGGAFLWLRHGNARLLTWDESWPAAVAEHDGYLRLADPVSHRRAVVGIDERAILVVDRLEGRDGHTAIQTWPFHPSCAVRALSDSLVEVSAGGECSLLIALGATRPASLVIDQESRFSRRLESWEPAPRCRHIASWAGVVHLAALIVPAAPGEQPPSIRLGEDGDRVLVTVKVDGYERAILLSSTGAPEAKPGS